MAGDITVGDPSSVHKFIKRFGSHFLQEVQIGESVYQVFALRPEQYRMAKEAALSSTASSNGGLATMTPEQFADFQRNHLAPFAVREAGKVLAASGDPQVLTFLESMLVDQGRFGSYPNLFRLAQDPGLMMKLEEITDNSDSHAVLGIRFASLRMTVPRIQEKEFYDSVVDTNAILWESNI